MELREQRKAILEDGQPVIDPMVRTKVSGNVADEPLNAVDAESAGEDFEEGGNATAKLDGIETRRLLPRVQQHAEQQRSWRD